jgi:CHAD domain-containing protein
MAVVDTAYQLLACRYIEGQVKALKRHLRWARFARNIEHVHQARVASRRLRAGLRMFADCFPAGKFSRWRRQIRCLTRRLGAARDTDVQIEFLKKFISDLSAKSKKLRPGLRRLMLRLKQRRQVIQPKVIKALDRLDEKQVLAEIRTELNAITARCRPQRGTGLEPVKSTARGLPHIRSQFVFQQAQEHINDRLAGLFSFEKSSFLKSSK